MKRLPPPGIGTEQRLAGIAGKHLLEMNLSSFRLVPCNQITPAIIPLNFEAKQTTIDHEK
jgi:hypothetical protein